MIVSGPETFLDISSLTDWAFFPIGAGYRPSSDVSVWPVTTTRAIPPALAVLTAPEPPASPRRQVRLIEVEEDE